MAATSPKKTIVNPTLVGVDAGGAAGVSQKSGKGPVETDEFQVSSNLDVRVPRRTRLPQLAVGNNFTAPVLADATDALVLQDAMPKRRCAGPSSRKRKQARAANEVSAAIDNDESVEEVVNAAPDNDGGANPSTPEVSDDKGGVKEDGNSSAESVTPRNARRRPGGKFPRVSSNLNGARHRTNSPRLATAKAAAGAKGPEVIPLDNNDKFSNEGMSLMTLRPCKVGHTTPGKAAKLFVEAPSAEARDFVVKGVPTPAPLTMDDKDAYVGDAASNAVSKPCLTAAAATRVTAFANNVLVSGRDASAATATMAMAPGQRLQ
jgi:hypothetical protein